MKPLVVKYLSFADRYISPNHPRGGGAALRDFQLIWGLHFLPAFAVLGLVDVLRLPDNELTYWLRLAPLLAAFIGFPVFAYFRHRRIRNDIDRRFDEMPGLLDPDGDPFLMQMHERFNERHE